MTSKVTVSRTDEGARTTGVDGWTLRFEVDDTNRRAIEVVTSMSDGIFGRRGLPLVGDVPASALVLASGVFDDSPVPDLLEGPGAATAVARSEHVAGTSFPVELDLRHGIVTCGIPIGEHTAQVRQFMSAAHDGIHVIEVHGPAELTEALESLIAPTAAGISRSGRGAIAAAARRQTEVTDAGSVVRRITALASSPPFDEDIEAVAADRLRSATALPIEKLRDDHERRWNRRWKAVAIDLSDRPDLERRARFAQYHLLSVSGSGDESAIGARAATGRAYRGHVFWDTDVFVVPALAAMDPQRARAALSYRYHRLSAARQRAESEGRSGARFPWESADTGVEVTPTEAVDLRGETVEIKTGTQEEHIVADVAWSVMHYLEWTGDEAFAHGPAAEIMVETARYWHARLERDPDGSCHIRGVIGPDEYHETVDDNAFTNVMARWNLRAAADFCEQRRLVDERERSAWAESADRIVDGHDAQTGLHQQFEGYFDLDPVMVAGIGTPPLSADLLLGRARTARSQIIKQSDVLMLHHLLPDEMPDGSFEADLDFYLPRTAHGSSLSPAITASLLARAGRLEEAAHWLDIALGIDIDDVSRTTAGGLHLATMGGVWQALVFGFTGLRPLGDTLHLDPHVPERWGTLTVRCTFRSVPVVVTATADRLTLTCSKPIGVVLGGRPQSIDLGATRHVVAERDADEWRCR